MNGTLLTDRNLWRYLTKLMVTFCFFYYGTLAVIGLSAPEGYYSQFVAQYLNYVDWLRYSILSAAKAFLSICGYPSHMEDNYILMTEDGSSIRMFYSCIGFGVMSSWAGFVIANPAPWKKKVRWVVAGWLLIWCINVIRVSFLLILLNKHASISFGLDHHTWFNMVAYGFILLLLYFYHRSLKTVRTP